MRTGVVHLVWAPLGMGPVRDFLRSYRAHPAGADHELVIGLNGTGAEGGGGEAFRAALEAELAQTAHRLVVLPRPVLDLAAYGALAGELDHDRLCVLNSYAEILAEGWLGMLTDALSRPGVGLAAASGSWESQAEWRRGKPRHWLYQLGRLPLDRRDYPRFPNAHPRTSSFMLERSTALELGLDSVRDKRDAYLLESGRDGIAARLAARGLHAVVVGRNGRAYEPARWAESATFRSGAQRNLLIADNRTREWCDAPARLKARLARDAWGPQAGA